MADAEGVQEPKALRMRDYLQIITVSVLVALFLKSFVIGAYRIPSSSMEPTLLKGDFLLVNKFVYGAKSPATVPFTRVALPRFQLPAFTTPQHADLVVFDLPASARGVNASEPTTYVKRCIALPGDTIEIVNKTVRVNGTILSSTPQTSSRAMYPKGYADPRMFPRGSGFNEDNYGPLVVPKRGDTLTLSTETFFLVNGIIEHEGHDIVIEGNNGLRVDGVLRRRYVVKKNYYFMMGDNRDHSLDSRFWGFVPEENIVGKVMIVYWSVDDGLNVRWGRVGTIPR